MKNIVRLKILTLFIFKKRKCYATFKIKLCWDKQIIYVKKRVISSDLSYSLKNLAFIRKQVFSLILSVFFFRTAFKILWGFHSLRITLMTWWYPGTINMTHYKCIYLRMTNAALSLSNSVWPGLWPVVFNQ